MKIKSAKFLISSPDLKRCPDLNMPEFALLGRSNVGKSTFINTLVNQNKLAKTSNTPGKTRLINLFQIDTDKFSFILADLPGYGYAKVSKKEQESWQRNLEEYLLKRPLISTIQFIDARHEIQKNDILMQEWLKFNAVPCFNVLTKADYVSRNELNKKIGGLEKEFGNRALGFSSKNRVFVDGVLAVIEELVKEKE